MIFLSRGTIGWLEHIIWVYTCMHHSFSVSLCLVIFSLHPCAVMWHQTVTCNFLQVKNCCLCVLEGKYLCEDEKQWGKGCLRERERKESIKHWKESICAWKKPECEKKKSVWCVTVHLCIFVENHRGEISLSVWVNCQKSKERERGECAKMLRKA